MRFELKAIGSTGEVEALDFQAPDETSAVRSIEGRGYTVLSVRARHGLRLPWQRGAERFPVALFSQELRVLITAGLPLVEAIETLAQKERRNDLRAILERLAAVLRQGQPLSSALQDVPEAFSQLYVATVKAAEKTSDLAPALGRYIAYAGQLEAIKKRVINASIYPALLISVGGLVSLFLLLYVVPRFGHIYQDRGTDLPLFSRLLLTWGQAVHNHAPVVLGALAALVAGAIYALRLPRVRTALGDAIWRIPAIGERLKVYQLAGNLRGASSRRPFPSTRSPARGEPPQRRGGAWSMCWKSNSRSSPTASPRASRRRSRSSASTWRASAGPRRSSICSPSPSARSVAVRCCARKTGGSYLPSTTRSRASCRPGPRSASRSPSAGASCTAATSSPSSPRTRSRCARSTR